MAALQDFCEKPVITVSDPLFQKIGCKASWHRDNELTIFPSHSDVSKNERSGCGDSEMWLHDVQWSTDLYGAAARKLVNESHNIFLKVQKHALDGVAVSKKSQYVKFSREYRSVMKACVLELNEQIQQTSLTTEKKEVLVSELQLWDMAELVWNLCEILFIDAQPGGVLLSQLLDWLRWHFVEVDRLAREIMQEEPAHAHQQYWDTMVCFVLQGRLDEARQLLSLHPSHQTDMYRSMDELMRKMPMFKAFTGQSVAEFDMRWRHWQEECVQRLKMAEFSTEINLQNICRILCGEDAVFIEYRDLCESWYCMLVSRLLYQQPTVKAFDLQYHTQFCINAYGGNTQLQSWDNIIMAAIEFELHQVIKEASSHSGNWWLVSHLTDLLHHCDLFESQTLFFGSNLREFLLLEYASNLMCHPSLWQTAAGYLDHCQVFGKSYLEHYIERIPLDSEKKAEKVLRVCQTRELHPQVNSICKVMGRRALQHNRLGAALSWALRSKDSAFVTYLAERFIDEYSACGSFSHLDLIDNLGSSMALSPQLSFLAKFRDFHKLYKDREFKSAAELLLSLLMSKKSPKQFKLTLLLDALPLLETDEITFDCQQTYELLHYLEELNIEKKLKKDEKTEKSDSLEQEKVELLRLALAGNLARAILVQGSRNT